LSKNIVSRRILANVGFVQHIFSVCTILQLNAQVRVRVLYDDFVQDVAINTRNILSPSSYLAHDRAAAEGAAAAAATILVINQDSRGHIQLSLYRVWWIEREVDRGGSGKPRKKKDLSEHKNRWSEKEAANK
jgi:hypothetical protein